MLELKDFFHLPHVEALLAELLVGEPGLVLLAGLDAHAAAGKDGSGFIPSGRATLFRILARQLLGELKGRKAALVAEQRNALRLPRQMKRQITWVKVGSLNSYAQAIEQAVGLRPGLILVEKCDGETAVPILQAAGEGLPVLAQMETVYWGAAVARHLLTQGASPELLSPELLSGLNWIITTQRMPALCHQCKQPVNTDPAQVDLLRQRYPQLALTGPFYQATGCELCQGSGRYGEVTLFDFFQASAPPPDLFQLPSRLGMEEYLLRLAELGHLPLEEADQFISDQLHRAYTLLALNEQALTKANAALSQSNRRLQQKLVELEAANRVLEQRTEALISFQDMSLRLITSANLNEIAARVCRYSCDLGGACQAVLYYFHGDETAEILAAHGWEKPVSPQQVDARLLLPVWAAGMTSRPIPFAATPPGVADADCQTNGVQIPLIAQDEQGQQQTLVGSIIVYPKGESFSPGEMALLQAFANQAALALQRSDLIGALREKIAALEAAQAQIVQKERLEKELDLAREVQQNLLPRAFPHIPGYAFGVRSQPARMVGGDFYDVFRLDDGRFGLVIADVSDKGMPAALFMGLTRSLLLAEARRSPSPRAVLSNVNRLLLELGNANMFVTIFYGIVNRETRQLSYARAGHDWPLLLRHGQTQRLEGQGTFVGFWEEAHFILSEETIQLEPGDQLLLYTDGLTDVMGDDGRCFSLAQLEKLVTGHAHLETEQLCQAILDELALFQGEAEQFDDMTLLVMAVAG
jgi:serine phosphatase RsbU (regulator of sigma subunit)